MRTATTFRRTGLVIVPLALAGAIYACTRDNDLTSPQRTIPSAELALQDGDRASHIQSSPGVPLAHSSRKTRAQRKHAWVGAVHNEAMRDIVANREQWVGMDRKNARRVCDGLAALVQKYAPQIDQNAGVLRSSDRDTQQAREAVSNLRQCRPAATMSVFPAPNSFSAMRLAQGNELTGAYNEHVANFISAVEATDGSVEAVAAAGNAAINNALGLPQADFEAVVGVVTLTDSSAYHWNAYGAAGGFDGEDPTQLQPDPMSVFRVRLVWWKPVLKVLLIDAIGCWAGYQDGGGWRGCATWAIAGSAGAILAM